MYPSPFANVWLKLFKRRLRSQSHTSFRENLSSWPALAVVSWHWPFAAQLASFSPHLPSLQHQWARMVLKWMPEFMRPHSQACFRWQLSSQQVHMTALSLCCRAGWWVEPSWCCFMVLPLWQPWPTHSPSADRKWKQRWMPWRRPKWLQQDLDSALACSESEHHTMQSAVLIKSSVLLYGTCKPTHEIWPIAIIGNVFEYRIIHDDMMLVWANALYLIYVCHMYIC